MPACELRPATQYDTDAVYALICELKQAEFDHHAFRVGFNANLRDPNMRYHLALLDGEVVGMIGLHLQFHLHHVNWIGEIQELVVMPQARGLNVGSKLDRKSTRLNSSHVSISYAVFCLKKKNTTPRDR